MRPQPEPNSGARSGPWPRPPGSPSEDALLSPCPGGLRTRLTSKWGSLGLRELRDDESRGRRPCWAGHASASASGLILRRRRLWAQTASSLTRASPGGKAGCAGIPCPSSPQPIGSSPGSGSPPRAEGVCSPALATTWSPWTRHVVPGSRCGLLAVL